MDGDDDDASGILEEPEFQRYYEMLHGPYIAALMSRADVRRRGGAVRDDESIGASTLSDEVRAAFAESQANLAWTPEEDDHPIEAAGKHRDDARSVEDKIPMSASRDADDDFVIPEPGGAGSGVPPIDEDFEIARVDDSPRGEIPDDDSDFAPRDDTN